MNYTKNPFRLTQLFAVLLTTLLAFTTQATPLADFDQELSPSLASSADVASTALAEVLQLKVRQSGSQLVIEWPLATGWVLEQAPRLTQPIPWVQVSPTLYQVNATNMSVAVSSPGTNMFFRLRNVISAAPVPGLSGAWRLDENQGAIAQDFTSRAQTAQLSNVVWTTGRIGGGGLWFNGQPAGAGASWASISNGNYSVLPPTGSPFSVSLWFQPDAVTNGWRGLMGNPVNGSSGWSLALHTSGPGTNDLVFAANGPATLNVTGRKLLLPGQWHELTATYDGSEGALYLDSELLARSVGTLFANNQPIFFGGGVAAYDSFLGSIDEVRTYTNALSQESISLAGYWTMDENAGSLLIDSSIHGHLGMASGAAGWAPGKTGSGIHLSNATVRIPNDFSDLLPPTGGSFSLSFWLYPNLISSDWSGLMSCADGTNSGWSLALDAETPGKPKLRFWSTDSGGTLDLIAPVDLPAGFWSKLDLTFNGGIATIYLNGRKIQSDSGGIQGSTVPLVLGAVPGLASLDGIIDELKIYSRERGEGEVGPVAKVMWETALLNTSTNLTLQGSGPTGKTLTYSIVDTISPTNGTLLHDPGSPIVTYLAGPNRGPDAFTYTVSDGEFTSPPTIVAMSVVKPHWLSPSGGFSFPLDGTSPDHAWPAGASDALDAIWKTNQYYDCFFYAPGEYQTTGWHGRKRGTANPGCKHCGSGYDGTNKTTLKLVNALETWNEGRIFAAEYDGPFSHGFEVHDMLLDCNAANNPLYTQGMPIWISIPLTSTTRVDSITLNWDQSVYYGIGPWQFGPAQDFNICTRSAGSGDYVTNCIAAHSTGAVDLLTIGTNTGEILIQLQRRAPGVDFYSLKEIQVAGATVSCPTATVAGGGESRLFAPSGKYSILQAVDGDQQSVWASGPENQVQIMLPLQSVTTISQLTFWWNCYTSNGLGRFGPASDYQIQARDATNQTLYTVPFVRNPRTTNGIEVNIFGTADLPNPILTDQLIVTLNAKELGVDFYSLREISLQNGGAPVPLKMPAAVNSFPWGNYQVLRAFDGDPATQWTSDSQGRIEAMLVVGNNLKFTHLKVVGFGNKAIAECFPMGFYGPWPLPAPVHFGNVLIEDCIVTEPATNNTDGLTVFNVHSVPPNTLTNAVIRRCTVTGVKSRFITAQAFTATHVENCLVTDCSYGVYFEPNPAWGDNIGPVLIRSNQFLNVENGVALAFYPGAKFDSITCIGNEIVVTDLASGTAFWFYDTWQPGPSGSITNVAVLNNLVRFRDWSLRPTLPKGGILAGDMHNALFGNNTIVLGSIYTLRVRSCPSGFIPPPDAVETCFSNGPIYPPAGPSYPPCLDVLPPGYRRCWFNNRDAAGMALKVTYWNTNADVFASQQQWR